ncbi:bone morphogenetic protein 15 [Discoglossus pictus]
MPAPPLQLPLLFLTALLSLGTAECGVNVLTQSSSLPLIRKLLDHGPLTVHVATRRELSLQHLRFMLELYRRSTDGDGRPRASRYAGVAVRLVRSTIGESNTIKGSLWHVQTLKFSLQAVVDAEQLVKATIMHPLSLLMDNSRFFCKVDLLPNIGLSSQSRGRAGSRIWAETDFTSYLKQLVKGQRKTMNLQVQLICFKDERRPMNLVTVSSLHVPFLLLYFNHTLHSDATEKRVVPIKPGQNVSGMRVRKSRQVGTIGIKLPKFQNQSGQSKNHCILRPFWVSFHQLGWDHWIIAPHRYNPGYCTGDCPRLLHSGYNSPNHAIIQNFINQVVDGSVPRPSCVPYSYGPISVLMIEPGGNILYKEYENMIAQKCTCR